MIVKSYVYPWFNSLSGRGKSPRPLANPRSPSASRNGLGAGRFRRNAKVASRPGTTVSAQDVQDIYTLEEVPYLRVTHLEIDTRVAGRAELTILERTCELTGVGGSSDERACSTTP